MSELKRHAIPEGVETEGWTLDVSGSVGRPLQLERRDLTAFPVETFTEDFACTEGWVAEGLSWRGIRLGELLDRAAPAAGSECALVRASDGEYACSFTIDRLAESLLAVELDGDPLPPEHGGPARLVPTDSDSDCWESIKWVSEIELGTSSLAAESTARGTALGRIDGA